jgi:Mg-chelatase subunit ChlD
VDAVLVLDASQSMLEAAAPGSPQTKLDASREAARAFLDVLHLDQGDQASLVAFNAQATLLTGLTTDRSALDAALASIVPAPQTCLVCGVDAGAIELTSPRHKPGNAPVLILLTDGRSNPRPVSEAVVRAAEAKSVGVRVYTIGLGSELDEAALRAMASGAGAYFHAPSGQELAGIYREIAVDIPCPAGAFWGGR